MNKDFFSSLDARSSAYAERIGADSAQVELQLTSGRSYRLERVVELDDAWFHADVTEVSDPDRLVSLAVPYWQIQQVQFVRPRKTLRHAGFVAETNQV